jgi:hypothetical protein
MVISNYIIRPVTHSIQATVLGSGSGQRDQIMHQARLRWYMVYKVYDPYKSRGPRELYL